MNGLLEERRRKLGIFYTPGSLAAILAEWAVRRKSDLVLDPSYGGCAFLSSALAVLENRGSSNPGINIFGIDIDPQAGAFAQALAQQGVPHTNLLSGDFIKVSPKRFGMVDVIVGNPPFVRHHEMSKESKAAVAAMVSNTVFPLSKRAGYWAYFVIHSLAFLKTGGRMALILPEAVLQAEYAKSLRGYLDREFARVTYLRITTRIFKDTPERVVVLLAEGRGNTHVATEIETVWDVEELQRNLDSTVEVSVRASVVAEQTYSHYIRRLRGHRLGELAVVRIGLVTGANSYFVLGRESLDAAGIPVEFARPIIGKGHQLGNKITLTTNDMPESFVLRIAPEQAIPTSVQDYLKRGETLGLPGRYKCSIRKPWYRLPECQPPDAFFTYMNWHSPRIVLNHTDRDCTNSTHRLYWTPLGRQLGPTAIALGMLSSLTQLGTELVGRTYGGGVLKVEPGAVRNLWIPDVGSEMIEELFRTVQGKVLQGNYEEAHRLVDEAVAAVYGLAPSDLAEWQTALRTVRSRRMSKY